MDMQRRCGRCLLYYTMRDNEEDKCGIHTKKLYKVSDFNKKKHDANEINKKKEKYGTPVDFINDIDILEKCDKFDKK